MGRPRAAAAREAPPEDEPDALIELSSMEIASECDSAQGTILCTQHSTAPQHSTLDQHRYPLPHTPCSPGTTAPCCRLLPPLLVTSQPARGCLASTSRPPHKLPTTAGGVGWPAESAATDACVCSMWLQQILFYDVYFCIFWFFAMVSIYGALQPARRHERP